MTTVDLSTLEPADALYVAPHADDAALSCAGRLLGERARGLNVLAVTLFGPMAEDEAEAERRERAWSASGVRHLRLGLPEAAQRSTYYSSFNAISEGSDPEHPVWRSRLAELIRDVWWRTRAREVYLPLGVGVHVDHRLAHEAAMEAVQSGDGRNVFLYEERPEAFVPGAVRVRLAQLGAWLPPAAAGAADESGLSRYLRSFHVPPAFRGDLRGWGERMRSTGVATRLWREARAWQPVRGLGPRLQPLLHPVAAEVQASARELAAAFVPPEAEPLRQRVDALGSLYQRRLGSTEEGVERYWLLLPPRDQDGRSTVPSEGDAAIA